MHRNAIVALCVMSLFSCVAVAQEATIEPVHVASGTILTFHLQTRMSPAHENQIDVLPKGTVLQVRMLGPLNSSVDRDGTEFHGVIVLPVVLGNETVVHANAEVRGILALLRSKNHPDGFRYDLLITNVIDNGKSYSVTASLNGSLFEGSSLPPPYRKPRQSKNSNQNCRAPENSVVPGN